MKIPLWMPLRLVIMFPKKMQDDYINRLWDAKSDADILDSYMDSMEWVELGDKFDEGEMPTLKKIGKECQEKLDTRVLPQMKKRDLVEWPNSLK